jgi:hypothetical protein
MSEVQIFVLFNNENIKLGEVLEYPNKTLYHKVRLCLNELEGILRFHDVNNLINSGKNHLLEKKKKSPTWRLTDKETTAIAKARKEWEKETGSLEAQIFKGGGAKAVLLHSWHYKDAKYRELMGVESRVLDASKSFVELIWPEDMRTWPDSADREAKWSRGSCVLI